MNPEDWWTIPGWGLAFTMWALAGAVGAVIVLGAALAAWRGRRRRQSGRN